MIEISDSIESHMSVNSYKLYHVTRVQSEADHVGSSDNASDILRGDA